MFPVYTKGMKCMLPVSMRYTLAMKLEFQSGDNYALKWYIYEENGRVGASKFLVKRSPDLKGST